MMISSMKLSFDKYESSCCICHGDKVKNFSLHRVIGVLFGLIHKFSLADVL